MLAAEILYVKSDLLFEPHNGWPVSIRGYSIICTKLDYLTKGYSTERRSHCVKSRFAQSSSSLHPRTSDPLSRVNLKF